MEREEKGEALLLDRQLCFPLYAAARRVVSLYAPALAPLGLTYTQYLVMMVLWEEKRCTMGRLSVRLCLDSGTLTPLVKKLCARGLVTRQRDEGDERVVRLTLTEAGEALRAQALSVPETVGACLPLSGEEAARLYELLYRILGQTDPDRK